MRCYLTVVLSAGSGVNVVCQQVRAMPATTRQLLTRCRRSAVVAGGRVTGNRWWTVPTGRTLTIGGITGWVGSAVARACMRPIESVGDERDGEGS
jgi:hypothetical protein